MSQPSKDEKIKAAILNMLKAENIIKKELAVETLTESKGTESKGTELAVESRKGNTLSDNDIKKIKALLLFKTEYIKDPVNAVSSGVMNQFKDTLSGLKLIEEKKTQQDASEILDKLISVNVSNSEFENEMNKIFGIELNSLYYCKEEGGVNHCEVETITNSYLLRIPYEYVTQHITYKTAISDMELKHSQTDDNNCRYRECTNNLNNTINKPNLKTYENEHYKIQNSSYFIVTPCQEYKDDFTKKIPKTKFNITPDLQIQNYKLFACVEHKGSGGINGHYIAYIKIEDKWWIFDDDEKPELSTDFENLLYTTDINNKIVPAVAFYKNKNINPDLSKIPLRGLTNVKNTCYFNSILQVLVRIPEYFKLLKTVNITESISSIVPKTISRKKHLGVGVHKVIKLQKGGFIVICDGTVVDFEGDAIVNAANEECLGGLGVDGAIGRAGGDDLYDAREALPVVEDPAVSQTPGWYKEVRCPTGQAVITSGRFGTLKCDHVIHAVGPIYDMPNITGTYNKHNKHNKQDKDLADAYKESIQVANKNNIKTLAFSLLSANIFSGGRGLNGVLQIAIDTVKERTTNDMEVYMVGHNPKELEQLLEITKYNDTKQLEELPSYKINK
jgi:O-acetyl-ADP-ribose deacetylase